MVVTVVPTGMVEVAIYQVIDMIAVGHGFVPASLAVGMGEGMAGAGVLRGTIGGIRGIHGQDMLIYMVVMHVMKVAVMEIIDVVTVEDRGVSAAIAMDMGVAGMDFVVSLLHGGSLILPQNTCTSVQL